MRSLDGKLEGNKAMCVYKRELMHYERERSACKQVLCLPGHTFCFYKSHYQLSQPGLY
jgi:hypothetical protein